MWQIITRNFMLSFHFQCLYSTTNCEYKTILDFPGGPVVCMQCREHRFNPWSRKIWHATGQLNPCTTASQPVLWSLCSVTGEATAMRSLHMANREAPPAHHSQRKPTQQQRPRRAKYFKNYFKKRLKRVIWTNCSVWILFGYLLKQNIKNICEIIREK